MNGRRALVLARGRGFRRGRIRFYFYFSLYEIKSRESLISVHQFGVYKVVFADGELFSNNIPFVRH
jgi:hypothetical protein